MASTTIDEFFTYEARVASFQKSTKKRSSIAGGRSTKALGWPHKRMTAESLARAGFYFSPTAEHPDNAVCFLCEKGLDGWEEGDDPLAEHLSHTENCGWAILTAVQMGIAEYRAQDPNAPHMVEARKATFAGKWPHESKRGWKCKTKQLVEAGWKYTPTPESDDMATCAYCDLALDGWESSDKPWDEHHKRFPECEFFVLAAQSKPAPKKATRGKNARTSKASRLSIQSTMTTASEVGSVDELTTQDDSVLTTTSTMTAGGGKKPRAKKAAAKSTAAKGKKSKAKKEEEIVEPEEEQPTVVAEERPAPPPAPMEVSPPKPKRGKKRSSDAVEETAQAVVEAPPPKKRATRGRVSKSVEPSLVDVTLDTEMEDSAPAPAKKPAARKKARASTAKKPSARKGSIASRASSVSVASSIAASIEGLDDDDEIERQLQADLERPLTDDEDIMADSDSERIKAKAKADKKTKTATKATAAKKERTSTSKSDNFAMFDPNQMEQDDAEVDEELKRLEAEMQVAEAEPIAPVVEPEVKEAESEPEPEQLQVPKKGRKAAGTRKVSKQTKAAKAKVEEPPAPEEVPEVRPMVAAGSVVIDDNLTEAEPKIETAAPPKRGRGRPSKASLASAGSYVSFDDSKAATKLEAVEVAPAIEEPQLPPVKKRGRPSKASLASQASVEGNSSIAVSVANTSQAPVKRGRGRPKKVDESATSRQSVEPAAAPVAIKTAAPASKAKTVKTAVAAAKSTPGPSSAKYMSLVGDEADDDEIYEEPQAPASVAQTAPATPPKVVGRAQSAKQATISPSPSLQSSDAENLPPSSRPSTGANSSRVALAPIVEGMKSSSVAPSSPSKRNIIAGLESDLPWAAIDIDAVMGSSPSGSGKENSAIERLMKRGKDLSRDEKAMTVEEWVQWNASRAEEALRMECENMVGRFEKEGGKAMHVLEALVVDS